MTGGLRGSKRVQLKDRILPVPVICCRHFRHEESGADRHADQHGMQYGGGRGFLERDANPAFVEAEYTP
jgi:hypothetical protein